MHLFASTCTYHFYKINILIYVRLEIDNDIIINAKFFYLNLAVLLVLYDVTVSIFGIWLRFVLPEGLVKQKQLGIKRRYMLEILPIRRKTTSNQPINHSHINHQIVLF